MFKQGAFVNVLTSDSEHWKSTLANLDRLPSLDHIGLWLERIPRGNELKEIKNAFRGIELIVHGPFIHTSLVSHIPEIVTATQKRFDATVEFAKLRGGYAANENASTDSKQRRKTGARGGSRTHMRKNPRRILSPQRLPFRHPGISKSKHSMSEDLLRIHCASLVTLLAPGAGSSVSWQARLCLNEAN